LAHKLQLDDPNVMLDSCFEHAVWEHQAVPSWAQQQHKFSEPLLSAGLDTDWEIRPGG
jgi:hypothetical protein